VTDQLPVAKGMLDTLVLRALAWAPMHGFEITSWIEERTTRTIGLEEAAVYQSLYRLEAKGMVRPEWGVTANNRRARYYSITRSGKDFLKAETKSWLRYAEAVTGLLSEGPLTEPGR
jgi:PadR family transcriptional regulator, regulatory protein PadR